MTKECRFCGDPLHNVARWPLPVEWVCRNINCHACPDHVPWMGFPSEMTEGEKEARHRLARIDGILDKLGVPQGDGNGTRWDTDTRVYAMFLRLKDRGFSYDEQETTP